MSSRSMERQCADSAVLEPFQVVLTAVKDDPGGFDRSVGNQNCHTVFAWMKDVFTGKRRDGGNVILGFMIVKTLAKGVEGKADDKGCPDYQ